MSEKYTVKMLKTTTGADDGIRTKMYNANSEYEIGKSLFNSFVNMGVCKLVEKKVEAINPIVEKKILKPVIEAKKETKKRVSLKKKESK